MSADIFKRKMTLAIQLKLIFLALKWAVLFLFLKIVSNFSKKATPANSKQNLNIMQLLKFCFNFYNWDKWCHLVLVYHLFTCDILPFDSWNWASESWWNWSVCLSPYIGSLAFKINLLISIFFLGKLTCQNCIETIEWSIVNPTKEISS